MQIYYQNKPKLNGVYSINTLSKINDRAYIINIDEYDLIGTHWMTLNVNDEKITYFDHFGAEHIPKETRKFIGSKDIKRLFIEYKHTIQ